MQSLTTVIRYHVKRIERFVEASEIDRYFKREEVNFEDIKLKLPPLFDVQAEKLALALDIRRLAELLAVADVWVDYYSGDEKKFTVIGLNEFLDTLYRLAAHDLKGWSESESIRMMAKSHIGDAKRFQLKYENADGKTNAKIRKDAGPIYEFIINVTSKILHADEYSVQSHFNDDPITWLMLLMLGHRVLYLFKRSKYYEVNTPLS